MKDVSSSPNALSFDDIEKRFACIKVYQQGGKRAPHKPLLLLLMLSRCLAGKPRLVSFSEIERPLANRLKEFGRWKSCSPQYPFWHLKTDGIWELQAPPSAVADPSSPTPGATKTWLRQPGVRAGLPDDIHEFLLQNPLLCVRLAREIVDAHFEESIQEDVLAAVGIDAGSHEAIGSRPGSELALKASRDPDFRERILRNYQYRCAICDLELRLGSTTICLEAAHVKSHRAGGPGSDDNGVALCTLHHKLFDRGAMTITPDMTIAVSEEVNGHAGIDEWVPRYRGKPLRQPQKPIPPPLQDFVHWHVSEVFHGEL